MRTLYTEGFSQFVTSLTAPIATGRSESCRVGLSPTRQTRLSTAHYTINGYMLELQATSEVNSLIHQVGAFIIMHEASIETPDAQGRPQ